MVATTSSGEATLQLFFSSTNNWEMPSFLFKFPNYVWDEAALLKKRRNNCLSMLFNFSSFFCIKLLLFALHTLTTLGSKYMTIETKSVLLLNVNSNIVSFPNKNMRNSRVHLVSSVVSALPSSS